MALEFQAFVDESQSKEEFVLGGHIATAETWTKFARDWEELLPLGTRAKNGNMHFKMSEMALTRERMDRVPQFYKIIDNYNLLSISCRMNLEDFVRAQERLRLVALRMSWTINWGMWANPYFVTFRLLLDKFHAERQMFENRLPLTEKIDFIFDDRSEKKPILTAWDETLEKMEDNVRPYYGATPRFEDDQRFLALQAADLWAWWVRDWYEEDAIDVPDKMKAFDFGKWRGKQRSFIAMSASEDGIVDTLQSVAVSNFVEGNIDPISFAALKSV